MLALALIAILVALPGAVLATMQIIDRFHHR